MMVKPLRNQRAPVRPKRAALPVTDRRANGDQGEAEVIKLVPCPNCESRLMKLPPSFPIYDVQCRRCLFRAQVKSAKCPPKGEVFGGGLDIMAHVKRAGALAPILITNFSWRIRGRIQQAIYLFPFIGAHNMRPRVRSQKGLRPGYREFNYVGLMDD